MSYTQPDAPGQEPAARPVETVLTEADLDRDRDGEDQASANATDHAE